MPQVFAALFAALGVAFVVVLVERARARAVDAAIRAALAAGTPRRARALARLEARRVPASRAAELRLAEARALFWEGDTDRALALLRSEAVDAEDDRAVVVELLVLAFSEVPGHRDEARAILLPLTGMLEARPAPDRAHVRLVRGLLALFEEDLASSRQQLAEVAPLASRGDPVVLAADFVLAAVADREGNAEETRARLASAMTAGDVFVAPWARAQWETLFPTAPLPVPVPGPHRRPRAPLPRLARLLDDLLLGLDLLALRTRRLEARAFSSGRVAALVLLTCAALLAPHLATATRQAYFLAGSLVPLLAPPFLFLAAAWVATRGLSPERRARVVGGFFAAMPPLVLLHAALAPGPWRSDVRPAELVLAAWALLVFGRLVWRTGRRPLATALGLVALVPAWLAPMHLATQRPLFLAPPTHAQEEEEPHAPTERIFAEAELTVTRTDALAHGRPSTVDLYLLAAAGWADQDVFVNEVRSVRALLDDRFDTRGRSLALSNDPSTRGELPLASTSSLRLSLNRIAGRMNPQDDVLFLFVTSHGSREGLALRFPKSAGFEDETLRPADVKTMLDEAGIRHRVLVFSGCESGVFADVLANDDTLVATASANDRSSYGCAAGNAYTDFGRAVFGEELTKTRSFPGAFEAAREHLARAEAKDGRVASAPRIVVGRAIEAKLRALEARLESP